jgi:four helix bundle protein
MRVVKEMAKLDNANFVSRMAYIESFQDLEVYKISRTLAKDIFEISKSFPKEERYSLTDQVRRSSRSIGAQVAEAWAKRDYERHFQSKLTDADGEQLETQHWIATAKDCNYLTDDGADNLMSQCIVIGKMINSMMAGLFCNRNRKS